MPAAYINNREENEDRRQTEGSLSDHVEKMHQDAHRADDARARSRKENQNLRQFENRHRSLFEATTRTRARCYLILMVIAAVYILDTVLFGAAAALLAKTLFPDSQIWLYITKFAIPAVILVIELWIAILIYEKRTEVGQPGTSKTRFNPWFFAGLIFALGIPLFIVASHPDVVRYLKGGDTLASVLQFRLLGLLVFALIAHIVTIFTGKYSSEAKSYFLFRYDHRRMARRLSDLDENFETFAQSVVNDFNRYYAQRQTFNRLFPAEPVPVAEFDVVTRSLINERFGREVIQGPPPTNEPGGEQAPIVNEQPHNRSTRESNNGHSPFVNADPGPSTAGHGSPPPTSHNGTERADPIPADGTETENENEYLRQTLSRRVRDADDEF